MGKKTRRERLSDRVQDKTKNTIKTNPFEVHFSRQKINVLGRKSNNEKGLPGVSRAQALKKRKSTLLQEYKIKSKSNKFMDRRIGERNSFMTSEDKLVARFTAERMKAFSKKNRFNLAEDEFLTHKGKTLNEIEKFDDPGTDDEEDEEETDGKLGADFVGDAHFGGGILKKVDSDSKSRKDLIDQLIAESKKRKAEKQKLKEETHELTEQLDTEWKSLLAFVAATKRKKEDEFNNKDDVKSASYDKLSRELKFESRGNPTDKLKSEEEEARKEKEKLEKLEEQRFKRMQGEEDQTRAIKHRSADDLDDGLAVDDDEEVFVQYDLEGNLLTSLDGIVKKKKGEEDGDDGEEDDEDEGKGNEEEEEDEESEEEEDSSSELDLTDLKDAVEEEIQSAAEDNPPQNTKPQSSSKQEVKQTLKDKNHETEIAKADNELPFVLNIPDTYEEFEKQMFELTPGYQCVVVERMIKCGHPSLKEGNKQRLVVLFTYLLQHIQDTASDKDKRVSTFDIVNRLTPYIYDLVHTNPVETSLALLDVIREKKDAFMNGKHKIYPDIDTLVFFKLVGVLFPTSDFRHRVVTPTMLFMTHLLATCKIQNSVDICKGLFICTLLVEFTALSKRFSPEVVNFIRGVLRMSLPHDSDIKTLLPFKLDNMSSFLYCGDFSVDNIQNTRLTTKHLLQPTCSDKFKLKSLNLALTLGLETINHWSEDPACYLIYEPFIQWLSTECYPQQLHPLVNKLSSRISQLQNMGLKKLVQVASRPKPLKLYEPNIVEITDTKRRRPMSKEKQEREKLIYKVKKETKGALREIRRDKAFIAKIQFKERQKSDAERKRKVMEIYGTAAQETGEYRKLKKQKR